MTSPLREMTVAARRMAGGDYDRRCAPRPATRSASSPPPSTRWPPTSPPPTAPPGTHRQRLARAAHADRRAAGGARERRGRRLPRPTTRRCVPRCRRRNGSATSSPNSSTSPGSTAAPSARPRASSPSGRSSTTSSPRPAHRRPGRGDATRPRGRRRLGAAAPGRRQPARQRSPPQPGRGRRRRPGVGTRARRRAVARGRDRGPGIVEADWSRVFERFTRGGSDDGGTGLGLAIARWAVELHGGSIAVVGEPPGCRIRVSLPPG